MTRKTIPSYFRNVSPALFPLAALGLAVSATSASAQNLYVSQSGDAATTITTANDAAILDNSSLDKTSSSAVASSSSESADSRDNSSHSNFFDQYLPMGMLILGGAWLDRSLTSGPTNNSFSASAPALVLSSTSPALSSTGLTGTTRPVLKAQDAGQQATLVSWSFDNQSLTADGGVYAGDTITPSGLTNPTPNGVAGVAYATKGASGASTDFYLRAGIGGGGTNTNSNEGGYLQWSVSTAGYSGTTVSFYADNSSATSGTFTTETLYYSTDGTNFTQAAAFTLTQSFVQETTNVSSINAAIDNNPNAAFRLVFTGSTNYAGTGGPNARVDALNIVGTQISSAPEPSGTVAMLLGAGLLSMIIVRRQKSLSA